MRERPDVNNWLGTGDEEMHKEREIMQIIPQLMLCPRWLHCSTHDTQLHLLMGTKSMDMQYTHYC